MNWRWFPPLFLCACPSPEPPEPIEPASFVLSVENGFGSGTYEVGEVIDVFAGHDPSREVFVEWSGDVDALDSRWEWHTRIEMPDHDVTISAGVASTSATVEEQSWTGINGTAKSVFVLMPDETPTAVLLLLHGSGGTGRFVLRTEEHAIAVTARERGWLVLSPTAEESATGVDANGDGVFRWNTALDVSNADIKDLDTLLEAVLGGPAPEDAPVYVAGMSNGGAMALALNQAITQDSAGDLPALASARAFVTFCARGPIERIAATGAPHAWFMCAEDGHEGVGPEAIAEVEEASLDLDARGVRNEVLVHEASVLYPERFARVDGIDEAMSRQIYDELVAAGFVVDDWITTAPIDIRMAFDSDSEVFPTLAGLDRSTGLDVFTQIDATYADHQMFSDHVVALLDFLSE